MVGSGSLMSVQYAAVAAALLVHLMCFCCQASSSGIRLRNETDRLALLEFKSMVFPADPSAGSLSSWNDSTHFCEWYGVSCSKRHYGRVTALNLSSLGLYGSISPHVGNLSFLRMLNLYNNSFVGEIPLEIGRLGRLQQLVLYNNSLGGEIPSNISGCSALIVFDVYNNKLVGGLPWQFGLLNKLRVCWLALNNLYGSIPPTVGNLSSLEVFVAAKNKFSGRIPDTLGQLKHIQFLDVVENNLSGKIPPSVFNLSSLTEIWIGYNQFHGNLPWNIGILLPNLLTFNVHYNQFSGSVPPSLFNASNLVQLQLQSNHFTGGMPSMAGCTKHTRCAIYHNSLGSGKVNDLSFLSSLTNATDLESLEIQENNFGGSLPHDIGNLSINLKDLRFNRNKISGNIPVEVQYLVNLEQLWASNNNLTDEVPTQGVFKNSSIISVVGNSKLCGGIATLKLPPCNFRRHSTKTPSNVLLDKNMVAHVGDFGLARFLAIVENPSSTTIGIKGTVGYVPPEYGTGNEVSKQGDVYSYGILLLELFTGRRPTDETFKDGLNLHNIVKHALSKKRTSNVVDPILLDELLHSFTTLHNDTTNNSEKASKDIEELMSSIFEIGIVCSSDIPEERVGMSQVVSKLIAIKEGCAWSKRR